MTFNDAGSTVGEAPVSVSNTASYPPLNSTNYPAYSIGAHSAVAKYPGDASYSANSSMPASFNVVKAPTGAVVTAPSNSILSVASTTLTIYVRAASVGAGPTGTITAKANGLTLASASGLSGADGSSQATIVINGNQLAAGSNNIALSYSGDTNYTGSVGSIVVIVSESKFNLTNSGQISIAAGATTGNTATITASPINNFVGSINLSCLVTAQPAGAASPATCQIPATVNLTGSAPVTSTLGVITNVTSTPGSYVVTVTGTDAPTGKITSSTAVAVMIVAPIANPGFALGNSGNLTLSKGATTVNTATINITPSGGLTGSVGLACAVTTSIAAPNDLPTCSIPATAAITSGTSATATLTVSSTAATATAQGRPLSSPFAATGGVLFAVVMFFGIPRRRRHWTSFGCLLLVILLGAVVGCGGSSSSKINPQNSGTTPGTYVVTVTGTAPGLASQTTVVTVTIN